MFAVSRAVNGEDHVSYTLAGKVCHNVSNYELLDFLNKFDQVGNFVSLSK